MLEVIIDRDDVLVLRCRKPDRRGSCLTNVSSKWNKVDMVSTISEIP
jgi:hypothetical protein